MRNMTETPLPTGCTSWIETHLDALSQNTCAFRERLTQPSRLIAVVKSNAYGHGATLVVPALQRAGADGFAVVNLAEGIAVRQITGPKPPIIVLGLIPHGDLGVAIEQDLQPTIYDELSVRALALAARTQHKTARVHIKIETGTNRQGVRGKELLRIVSTIANSPGVEIAGVSTHFADIEDTTNHDFAGQQIARFQREIDGVRWPSGETPPRHNACSAAAILFPETHLELVRIGIGLYGLWPSRETLVAARERKLVGLQLEPAMSWKCLVAQVKDVPTGDYVSYGRSWRATRPSKIAVLPVGYFDGYPRALSDKAHVLIAGRRARVVGRVCMNMMMVDVTDLPEPRCGDTVVLLGCSGNERLRAEELADWAGTIHYEIVSRINPALPRIASSSEH